MPEMWEAAMALWESKLIRVFIMMFVFGVLYAIAVERIHR